MSESAIQKTDTAANTEVRPTQTREETRYRVPPVDIYETQDGLEILADLPGVASDGVEVHVDNGVLTISGRVSRATDSAGLYREFTLLDYYRQFQLGETIDTEKIKAELRQGVLKVQLPHAEAAKPRQIEVSVA